MLNYYKNIMSTDFYKKYKKYKSKYLNEIKEKGHSDMNVYLKKSHKIQKNDYINEDSPDETTVINNIKKLKLFGGDNKDKYMDSDDDVYMSDSEDDDNIKDQLPNEMLDDAEELENIKGKQFERIKEPKSKLVKIDSNNIIQDTDDETGNKYDFYDEDLRVVEENIGFLKWGKQNKKDKETELVQLNTN